MPPRPPSDILDNEPGDPASEPSNHGRGGPPGPPPPGGSPHESEHGDPAGPPGGDPGGDNGGGPGGPPGGPGGPPGGGPPGGGPPGGGPAPPAANPSNDLEQTFLTTLQGINTFLSRPPTMHSTKPHLKEPPTFSGTDPEKLRPWLIDIATHLSDCPDDFLTDEKKVNFTLSFLTGVAKDFFSPDIFMALQDPFARTLPWQNDFHKFLSENFGPFDSVGTAENTLNNLVMDASKPIANYITHFNAAATLVGWDNNSLRFQFWRGSEQNLQSAWAENPKLWWNSDMQLKRLMVSIGKIRKSRTETSNVQLSLNLRLHLIPQVLRLPPILVVWQPIRLLPLHPL